MDLRHIDLNETEDLVVDQRPHWSFVAGPLLQFVLVLVIATVAIVLMSSLPWWTIVFPGIVVAAVAVRLVSRWVRYRATRLTVTTERLIFSSGVFGRKVREIPVRKISNLTLIQKLAERLFRSGSFVVEHSGDTGRDEFVYVRRPDLIVRFLSAQVNKHSSSAGSGYSAADELSKLAELHRAGSISLEDYERAKIRLLNQI